MQPRGGARQCVRDGLDERTRRRCRACIGRREFRNVDLARARALDRLGSVLPGVGAVGPLSRDPRRSGGRRGRAQRARRRPGDAARRSCEGRWLTANGVVGLWPANAIGDDIEIYADDARTRVLFTWRDLRQQNERPPGKPNYCASRFRRAERLGRARLRRRVRRHDGPRHRSRSSRSSRRTKDDYSAIMLKALADRLAEAFAEWLHRKVRRELWGYAADEALGRRRAGRARNTAASGRRRDIPRARITR